MKQLTRDQLIEQLLDGCPAESLRDHSRIVDYIASGEDLDSVIVLPAVQNWPETYAYLQTITLID